jgi:hypothetical protein
MNSPAVCNTERPNHSISVTIAVTDSGSRFITPVVHGGVSGGSFVARARLASWILVVWFQTGESSDHGENGKQDSLDGPWRALGNDHIRIRPNQEDCLEEVGDA